MVVGVSLQLSPPEFGIFRKYGGCRNRLKSSEKRRGRHCYLQHKGYLLSSCALQTDIWSLHVTYKIYRPLHYASFRHNLFRCYCSAIPSTSDLLPVLKSRTALFSRSYDFLKKSLIGSGIYTALKESPLTIKLTISVAIIVFAVWGLGPLMCCCRSLFFQRNANNWKKSRTHFIYTACFQPILLWTGSTLICNALDPIVLPTVASQTVKQRLLNFVQSLSTVLAFAYCLTSLVQQAQKFFLEKNSSDDARNMGYQFAGKAIYTALWVAAFSLFMELLGFSTQKWVTAGGLGTVLLTLAGREIFTNFLSSVMIHATRPFVLNEWIKAKIEGYEVSGTVEHVGWWSPTIIRGDDREAIHIPNHKFTVNVVRNLTQKTHWRIKTHLAISHLDVNKISIIVADMRKVLAKNPQIEQQRLHRRVFLENINPENQALMILISCFVKTSRFEEYLCVQEAVILDLLRVISHHRARLATPIRTVQKTYTDSDIDNIPFSGSNLNRPLLLIDIPQKINGDDKAAKPRATTITNEDQASKNITLSNEEQIKLGAENMENNEKQQEKKQAAPRQAYEDNIVLGVALEGSKRTLPIEDGPTNVGTSEMAGSALNGNNNNNSSSSSLHNSKDRKGQTPPEVAGSK